MSGLLFIATAALVATSACAKNIAVNWTIPTTPNAITAAKGDVITFTWEGTHNVYQVADAAKITDLGICEALVAASTDLGASSPVTFTMGDKAVYFGCQVAGQCAAGHHLAVTPEAAPVGPAVVDPLAGTYVEAIHVRIILHPVYTRYTSGIHPVYPHSRICTYCAPVIHVYNTIQHLTHL